MALAGARGNAAHFWYEYSEFKPLNDYIPKIRKEEKNEF